MAEPIIAHNRWDLLEVPALGEMPADPRVSVVIPYYQQAPEHRAILERTLAGLGAQTYPNDRFEVIVVDDGSDEPPVIGQSHLGLDIVVLRQHRDGFGAPRARNLGAANATGDVLLFLDADMIPEAHWIEAHARWHAACGHAVTLGPRRHVDATGVEPNAILAANHTDADGVEGSATPADGADARVDPAAAEFAGMPVGRAVGTRAGPTDAIATEAAGPDATPGRAGTGVSAGLAAVFAGRDSVRPAWIDEHLARTNGLTGAQQDLFRVVASGNLGVGKALFDAVGGFDEGFDQWGGEDTELGYRLFVAGGLLVHDEDAACWHQGHGEAPDASERISLVEQRPKMGQSIAHHGFRRIRRGRTYRVPRVVVTVAAADVDAGAALSSIESVLASSVTDLVVHVEPPADEQQRRWLERQFDHDARVTFDAATVPWTAPYRMRLVAPAVVGMESIDRILERLTDPSEPVGVIYATVPPSSPSEARFVAWQARAVNRVRLVDALALGNPGIGAPLSGAVASGSVASGSVASGSVASGSVASGSAASGSVASGDTGTSAVVESDVAAQDSRVSIGAPPVDGSLADVLAAPADDATIARVADVFGRHWVSGTDFAIGHASTVDPLTDEAAAASSVAVRGELQALGEVLARLDPAQQRQLVEVARTGLTQLGPRQMRLLMSVGQRTLRLLTRVKRGRRRR